MQIFNQICVYSDILLTVSIATKFVHVHNIPLENTHPMLVRGRSNNTNNNDYNAACV